MRLTIACICALWAFQAGAQSTTNPFELKWKSGERPAAKPALVDTSSAEELTIETSEIVLEEEIAPAVIEDSIIVDSSDAGIATLDVQPDAFRDSTDEEVVAIPPPENTDPDLTLDDDKESASTDNESEPDDADTGLETVKTILPGPTRNVGVMLILTMLGLSVLVLTWAVNANRGFIKKIYRAAMNENLSALLLREQKFASLQYLYYIVYATFFINASLFLFLISRYSGWDFATTRTPLLLFLGILVGIYLARHIFMRVLGSTFGIGSETTHYNFNILLFNILAGIILIPVNLFLAFGPEAARIPVIYGGLGLVGLLYLMRQLRGVNIASHLISTNVFQFFVYLCAVEILPVLVLFKYFITD